VGPRRKREVVIDALAEGAQRNSNSAVVCIDVLLSSSTLVTAAAGGRRVAAAATLERGRACAAAFEDEVLLLNEAEPPIQLVPGRDQPGLARLEGPGDRRPFVLVSPSIEVLERAAGAPAVYVACLRNLSATVDALAELHDQVAIVGAGHGNETRCEDQLAAAWMARQLVTMGYEPAGHQTVREMDRWALADLSVVALGRGAEHWRRQGREQDVDFVLSRVDDLELVCVYEEGKIRGIRPRSVATLPLRAVAASH
jgi:phosphosulfolactate phosphohydrolase-like enzyme